MNPSLQVSHPFTQEALDTPPIRITKAEAVYLYTEDGRRLIDGISGGSISTGTDTRTSSQPSPLNSHAKSCHLLCPQKGHGPLA